MSDNDPHPDAPRPGDPPTFPAAPPYAPDPTIPTPSWSATDATVPSWGPPTAPGPAWGPPAGPPAGPPDAGWAAPPPPSPEPPEPARGSRGWTVALVVAMVFAALVGGLAGAALHQPSTTKASGTAATQTPSTDQTPQTLPNPGRRGRRTTPTSPSTTTPANGSVDAQSIADAVDPAIVDINTTLDGGEAAGTGMVLTSDGLVLTNNHVIADATDIRVQVDGTGPSYQADVLGYDTTADVALLKLKNASNLKTVSVGDSSTVSVSDPVVALGNALGQGGTPAVAAGAVTGLNQSISVSDETGRNQERLSGLIEINAALQPGDSGGPLVDADGKVIGMDTAASATSRRSVAADGYAIPINDALAIANQIKDGKASDQVHIGDRALLGVEIDSTSRDATVAAVEPGSPADDAGLAAGDTITAIDGTQVSDGASLRSALDPYHPGDHVTVTWIDGSGAQQHADVTLTKGPPA